MAITNKEIFNQIQSLEKLMVEIEENLNDNIITIGRALKVIAIKLLDDFEEINFEADFFDF